MAETDYARASVLLFDPVHVNQRTTRYALFEIGFRQIECVSSLREFKSTLAETAPALVVAETSATDTDIFNLVRAVRRGDLGAAQVVMQDQPAVWATAARAGRVRLIDATPLWDALGKGKSRIAPHDQSVSSRVSA